MVFVQKWPLFQTNFFGNIGKENVFYDILERKNSFLHGFGQKLVIFQKPIFLGNIGQENVFDDIQER